MSVPQLTVVANLDVARGPGPQRARQEQKEGDPPGVDGGQQPAPACVSASDLATHFVDVPRAQTAQALGDRVGAARYVERHVKLVAG